MIRIGSGDLPDTIVRAAQLLYLNRTAFGGMYRLNGDGEFNVPYGGGERTPSILWRTGIIEAASSALRNTELRVGDFEPVLDRASSGDVAYCDPTYTVTHDRNAFVRYNERNFSWADQERLAKAAIRAAHRGATVVITNAHHRKIKELYKNGTVQTLARFSALSPDPSQRRPVHEFLIILWGSTRHSYSRYTATF